MRLPSDIERDTSAGRTAATGARSRRLAALLALMCLAVAPVGTATAQVTTDKMLESLLRPAGWRAEWAGPGGAGVNELVFERRADQVVIRIRLITPFEMSCENPVTLGADRVTFDGCRDPAVTLVFDATNAQFPFQGQSPRGYVWKLRAK
jgi:hypothetical protein